MRLTKYLRDQGYDLIEGPVRNHKPLQLWLKKSFDEIQPYYSDINHAFKSDFKLVEQVDSSLSINTTKKDDYSFNIGISILEELLKSIGLGTFELSSTIKSGKKVTISYDNAVTRIVPIGDIETYLINADFRHPNTILLRNANRNNIIIITGVVSAQSLVVDIETDFDLDSELITSLNKIVNGKLEFSLSSQQSLKMISQSGNYFPIAVKANRLRFNRGVFTGYNLVSDNRNWF